MRGLGGFLQETHRRAVWQVLGTYVAGAWVVLQVIEVLMETIGLPDWVPRFALVLLLIGLPIVTATAVIQGAARTLRDRASAADEVLEADVAAAGATAGSEPPGHPAGAGSSDAAADTPTSPRLFTWRNVAFGGLAAFALLGVATAGWMIMRTLGIGPVGSLVASGVIEEGERIVLAELDGDPELATGATLALRVDLEESAIVSPMDPAYVATVLGLMQRPADAALDAALAREVAIRAGAKAVLEGEISPLGASHVLTVRLVAAETGEQLASFRETAEDDSQLLDAIDRLSRKLRERLGESLKAIHASEPLEDVTTGSLEALRKYSQGWAALDAGNDAAGIALLEEAVALDSTFAMAWRKLATATFGDRRVAAATKAYEYRDRLTDRERYHTLGIYESYVTGNYDAAVVAYRTLLDTWPDDAIALNNLGVTYMSMSEPRLAAEQYQRAMSLDPLTATYPQNLVLTLYGLDMADSAGVVLDRYAANLPGHVELPDLVFRYATAEGDYGRAREALDRRLESQDPGRRRFARLGEGWLTLLQGDLAGAERI
ncbi:MAG: tetratricopeptide repeat protein, partial [Gemmatimonadota bacterium]|nr:tetratricopeptide repeat protein [Gemmatimonadota bacterium]